MTRRLFIFDPPDRFMAGTIGEPGNRTFYLQARAGGRIVSVALEKVQVAVLAERLGALLDELDRRGLADATGVGYGESVGDGTASLDEPLNEVFRAGTLSLGWDADDDVVIVEARAQGDEDEETEPPQEVDDDDPDGPDLVRVRMSAADARAFVDRAVRVVASGRPPCPLCGQPLDPQGHLCPRRNGTFLN
jgi:uncharacterized repeat protein (TIGR03847 family)